jgi:two-component system, NarL family, invasion response regulator UvrY
MNVLIAEDHAITAKLIANTISQINDIDVVGIAANGQEVVKAIDDKLIDVILMDINMPYLDGLQATEKVLQKSPNVKVLVISGYSEPWIIKKSLNVGALGFINKKEGFDKIGSAITTVFNGFPYLDDTSLQSIVKDYSFS